jgi:O-antigen ligase
MKALVIIGALVCVWPLYLVLRGQRKAYEFTWVLVGILPILATSLFFTHVSIVSVEWIGYSTGVEIQAIDLLLLALLFMQKEPNPLFRHLPFVLYSVLVTLSMAQADNTLTSFFGAWQICKGYFVAFVVARACMEEGIARRIVLGMAIGIVMQVFVVVWQKFALGIPQPPGTFSHQNELGVSLHFVLYPSLSLLVSGAPGLIWPIACLCGSLIVAMIASRAAAGLSALGILATFVLQSWWHWSMRKAILLASSVFLMAAIVPLAYASFQARLSSTPLQEDIYDEREAFSRAAAAMLADHPFGIGTNQYSYVGRAYGYSLRAGVAPFEGNLSSIVHNVYRLMAAETGYLGVLSFVIFLAAPLVTALKWGLRRRRTPDGALLLGCAVSLALVYVHSGYEWILFWPTPFYMLSLTMGMVYGLAWRASRAASTAQATQKGPAGAFPYPAGRLVRRV